MTDGDRTAAARTSVGSMSEGGQKRRCRSPTVVARRAQLWLLDEPHAGLDQDGRDIVDQLVRDATHARWSDGHRGVHEIEP